MIAVQLMSPDLSPRAPKNSSAALSRERPHGGCPPAEAPATVTAQFRSLDPGIVSDAIPAFFIGRNKEGSWVARDANGRIGGVFLLESSALSFARRNSRSTGCATIFPSETIELDLENRGNPFVTHLAGLRHLATRLWRQTAALSGRMKAAVNRRLNDFHLL